MAKTIAVNPSLSLTEESGVQSVYQKIGGLCIAIAVLALIAAAAGAGHAHPTLFLTIMVGMFFLGAGAYALPYYQGTAGIRNNSIMFKSMTNRGTIAWILAIVLTGFYIIIYWFPWMFEGLIRIFDPLSKLLTNQPANQWFMYGAFYTLAVLTMGIRFIARNRNNRYQVIRTLSVMFFQTGFGFLIPMILKKLNEPEFYFAYFWPLKYSYLFPSDVSSLMSSGNLGVFMVFWGAMMTFIATPILTYKYGKRWYCSWVCGCGGLAETAGDPYRHLSDKSLKAWKIERWMVHSVLVFITVTTILLWLNSYYKGGTLGSVSGAFAQWYGFFIGAIFSGVIGVGFYPIMGSRVWCRFGCPMAAILGIFQRYKSKFRITTNGGQCISCGNCSTYCEMGIDVRAYAQKGQNIVRASCVGCGICASVCPRGVLKLENGEEEGRINEKPITIGNNNYYSNL
ncbi:MAG TPA: 4Fe-4S dicluster domain-containing protein [Sphingobacteriaceae bacterium]|nr:4Fe-4S dicluster domain-containing protein [Sphingobacteriaceae bacterium]